MAPKAINIKKGDVVESDLEVDLNLVAKSSSQGGIWDVLNAEKLYRRTLQVESTGVGCVGQKDHVAGGENDHGVDWGDAEAIS